MIRMFMKMYGWLWLVPLAGGIGLAVLWSDLRADAARLDAEGVAATATVTSQWTTESHSRRSTTTHYHVAYRFSTGSALSNNFDVVLGEDTVSEGFYSRLNYGDEFPIRYVPGAPDLVEIEPGAMSEDALIAGILALAIGGSGLAGLGYTGRAAARTVRIRDAGVMTVGYATRLVTTKASSVLEFAYAAPDGTRLTGKTRPRRTKKWEGMLQGQPLTLFLDPADPKRVHWEGDVGPRQGAAPAGTPAVR